MIKIAKTSIDIDAHIQRSVAGLDIYGPKIPIIEINGPKTGEVQIFKVQKLVAKVSKDKLCIIYLLTTGGSNIDIDLQGSKDGAGLNIHSSKKD